MFVGHGQLKSSFCMIDGNGSSIRAAPLTFEDLIPTPMLTRAPISRKHTGVYIPPVGPDTAR